MTKYNKSARKNEGIIHILVWLCLFSPPLSAFIVDGNSLNPLSHLFVRHTVNSSLEDKLFIFELTNAPPRLKAVFDKQCQLSDPVFIKGKAYVLSSDIKLYEINQQGKVESTLDLSFLLKDLEIPNWTADLLHTSAQGILYGAVPTQEGVMFAFNPEHASKLMWHRKSLAGGRVSKPLFLKIDHLGKFVVVPFFDEQKQQNKLLILDASSGSLLKEILLGAQLHPINQLLAIDSQGQGFADFLFIASNHGLQVLSLPTWQLHHIPLGNISQMVVGRSFSNRGMIFYAIENKMRLIALNFSAAAKEKERLFTLEGASQFLLRQNKLIVLNNNKLKIYDAFTGKCLREEGLQPFFSFLHASENRNEIPIMLVRKPREKLRSVLVKTIKGLSYGEIEVDYERLGRKTIFSP